MYTKHFHLKMLPFENVPDPAFFFDAGDHARVRARVADSLKAGRGLAIVTGPIGSGKTTLSQIIKSDFKDGIHLIWIAEPPTNSMELFRFVAQELGLNPSIDERTFILRDIRAALVQIDAQGGKCLVIMDESHLITDDTLNGIRLLNNLEEGSIKLIQFFLLGQEEMVDLINRPGMEPFKQRISILEMLSVMNPDRIREYITHRLHVAGAQPSLFSDGGWEALILAFGAGSTPRTINLLCERSLDAAFQRRSEIVGVEDVYKAAEKTGLAKEVFHYMVRLKQEKEKISVLPITDNPPVEKPITHKKMPKPALIKEPETRQKSLSIPVMVFLLSAATLGYTIAFYFQRTGSTDPIAGLLKIIGLR